MNKTEKEEFIIGAIFLLANKLNQRGDQILSEITFKQWILLVMISKMKSDEKNINSIAEFMGTSRQNIKKMLLNLETKGYITIEKSKYDARALQVNLTSKTYQYAADHMTATANEADALFSHFSIQEIDNFVKTLQKLLNSFDIYNKGIENNE